METRYYINGSQVTKEEAEKQKQINDSVMQIEDLNEWLKAASSINFIVELK